jgi:hypothetical protein
VASQPSSSAPLALAENYRTHALTLRASYMRDMLALWPLLHSDEQGVDDDTIAPWLRLGILLVHRYRGLSTLLSQQYVERARLIEVGKPGPSMVPDPMPDEQIVRTLLYTGPGSVTRALERGSEPLAARRNALTLTLDASSMLVLNAGRDVVDKTVRADDAALGWMRVTDNSPCSFCAMLASRGAVYKSRESAGAVSGGFTSTWHNGCGCQIVPVFSTDPQIPQTSKDAEALWIKATRGLAGNEATKAYRRAVEGRSLPEDPINR